VDILVGRGKGWNKNPFKKRWLEGDTATAISKRTLARIVKEGKEVDKGTSASFSTPGKSRPKKKKVAVVDAFDEDVTRRLIHNFHVTQKE
jgi:hypothetical protein